jgi:hypothetical protein
MRTPLCVKALQFVGAQHNICFHLLRSRLEYLPILLKLIFGLMGLHERHHILGAVNNVYQIPLRSEYRQIDGAPPAQLIPKPATVSGGPLN